MHRMAGAAEMQRHGRAAQRFGQPFRRNQRAPGLPAGEAGLSHVADQGAGARPKAVGADQGHGLHRLGAGALAAEGDGDAFPRSHAHRRGRGR